MTGRGQVLSCGELGTSSSVSEPVTGVVRLAI